MTDAATAVRRYVSEFDGIAPDEVELRERPGSHGILVHATRAAVDSDETDDDRRRRWFSAWAIYVDGNTGELFQLPNHAAAVAVAEEYLADPEQRARARLEAGA